MKKHDNPWTAVLILIFLTSFLQVKGQIDANERAGWFIDARYGMFIHWGIYSAAEGVWKGEPLRNDNNYAEWIQYRNGINKTEYLNLLEKFNWKEIDPEKWVLLAKEAGMKYIVLTAKHHDGFALWNSKASQYNITRYTNPPRDILMELSTACRKHGLKLGIYYSHWIDWEHEYGWDHTKEITGISHDEYDIYWQEKVIPQMRELLTGYGPIDLIWFDMWIHHSRTVVTREQLLQLKNLIRELQPQCLVNSRLGLTLEEDRDVDIHEMGDNQIGIQSRDFPWQTAATVSHSWGYHRLDDQWKSTTSLLRSLINNVSLNGNYLLNIGPRANGEVPHEIKQRLREIGAWLTTNGESIYGCGAFKLPKDYHDWGRITCRETAKGMKVYLHLFNYPLDNKLFFTGVMNDPARVYLLADKQQKQLQYTRIGAVTTINLPEDSADPHVTVIAVEYDVVPVTEKDLVARNIDGGYSLTPLNIVTSDISLETINKQRRGTIPSHVVVAERTLLKWKIYIDEPGLKSFDISYSKQAETSSSTVRLKCDGTEIRRVIPATGKTVAEPDSDWVVERFLSRKLGTISFNNPGFHDVELEIIPGSSENIKFQWLWIR